jgi:CSLREA domain-containing protein
MRRRLPILAILLATFSSLLVFSGSYSLAQGPGIIVNSTADPGDGVCDASECTLREAIGAADFKPGPDTIKFEPRVFSPATIAVDSQLPPIMEALTIDGTGAGVILEPSGEVDTGLLVQDTDDETDTNFTLIGNSFTIRGFAQSGIFVCGDGGSGCGSGPISGVTITGSTIAAGADGPATSLEVEGVVVQGDNISNVSVDNNTSVTGGTAGIRFEATQSVSNVSVDNNGSVIADADGSHPGNGVLISSAPAFSVNVSNVSVSGNDYVSGSGGGIGIAVQADVTNVAVDNNGEITGGATGIGVHGDSLSNISIDNNGSVTGIGSVAEIRSYGILIGGALPVPPGTPSPGSTSAISNVSVRGNGGISGGDVGVSINGDSVRNVWINHNASISSANEEAVGIGGNSNRHIFVTGNRINAGGGGIAISGANPGWLYNVIAGNVVKASSPGSAVGILLYDSDRNLVTFNRVDGFAGEIPGLGGGIGVIFGSSNNLILGNVVDSEPDLFWDETGSGNRWGRNWCDTSVPDGLCG